jgi:dTDP-4-dehydrorhamnose reductase
VPRIAVVGANGMLGRDLVEALAASAREFVGLTRADLDVTDPTAAITVLAGFDVIVNCTAWNRVDDAETLEAEASAVNADGPANLAAAARATGARLIHISTDYVFDGTAASPIQEDAPRAPVSAYGRTKARGEELALAGNPGATAIVRTAWLYGEHGPSFPKTMLRLAAERETVSVVTDQVGQPTWTRDLAARLIDLIDAGVPAGIYHGTNSGETSWYGFAREIFRLAGLDPERVLPTDSGSFVRPAPRPAYSVLGHDAWAAIGLAPMRPWTEAVADAFAAGALR